MVTQKQVEAACEAMFNSAGKSCTRCGVPYSTGFGCGFWAVPEMKFIAEYVLDRSLPLMEGAQEMAKVIFESKLIVPDSMKEWQRQLRLKDARLKNLSIADRDAVETVEAARLAGLVGPRLVNDPDVIEKRIATGYELAMKMSWEHVVKEYFLPSLARTAGDV